MMVFRFYCVFHDDVAGPPKHDELARSISWLPIWVPKTPRYNLLNCVWDTNFFYILASCVTELTD